MDRDTTDLLHAPLAGIGHNSGAPAIPTPQQIHADLEIGNVSLLARRDELLAAAGRVPAEIDDAIEGRVIDFIKQINACASKAKEAFKAAKEPYLEGGRAVDGFFKKITDPLDAAKKTLNDRLTAHLRRKEAEERRRREEAERLAREAAETARREAEEAARRLAEESQLDDAIAKEREARQAAADAAAAARAAEAKAAELSRTRGDYGGVSSLRTEWTGELVDRKTLDLEALREHLPTAALEQAIRSFVKAGGRSLRGASIYERTSAVTR